MAQRDRRPIVRVDSDGVRTASEPGIRTGVWVVVAVIGVIAIGLVLLRRPAPDARRAEAPASSEDAGAGAAELPAQPPGRSSRERASRAPVRAGARPVPRPAQLAVPAPDDGQAANEPDDAGAATGDQPSGIALFPPPGTDPPKPGIIVPEDFELPPGYVRHHQATDDGQRLPAILMFHPDYEWVDERGEPLAIPEDHVVPPDLAPPGLPIEILQVPDTNVPQIEEPPGS